MTTLALDGSMSARPSPCVPSQAPTATHGATCGRPRRLSCHRGSDASSGAGKDQLRGARHPLPRLRAALTLPTS
eukprot:CAMPEP_0185445916 /NCGR_PEP_ID=MMETSP1365-20130426/53021_1 /TAXON_ID=38817 /ORGANISM="Gephyrocapsa oceanica, Strain RCC1303" /LENGTH=73 /DNA_ID=CAMNT_0028051695 /DNA_START=230 /DNA_END=448 /DNA_ORIENTATION=-